MTDVYREMLRLGFFAKQSANIRYSVSSDDVDCSDWVVHKQLLADVVRE